MDSDLTSTIGDQIVALWRLLWDERPIRFSSEDEEAVWRCLHRRCGMARMEAKLMLKYAKWVTYEKGVVIYREGIDDPRLHLIVEVWYVARGPSMACLSILAI